MKKKYLFNPATTVKKKKYKYNNINLYFFAAYIQHIGRGGRTCSGTHCNAILYNNSSDLDRPNISKEI